MYDFQVTNRSVLGGDVGSHRSPPSFLLVAWESYATSSRTATHFIIAIWIRINCNDPEYQM
jgi:hypothetical protein